MKVQPGKVQAGKPVQKTQMQNTKAGRLKKNHSSNNQIQTNKTGEQQTAAAGRGKIQKTVKKEYKGSGRNQIRDKGTDTDDLNTQERED